MLNASLSIIISYNWQGQSNISIWKPEQYGSVRGSSVSLDGRVILRVVVWVSGREWTVLGQVPLASTCYHRNDSSGSIKGVNFLEQLSYYQHLKANSVQRNQINKWVWSSLLYRLVGLRWRLLSKFRCLILLCIPAHSIGFMLNFQNISLTVYIVLC
jgi:hypothetical protein